MTHGQELVMKCFTHDSFEWSVKQIREMTGLSMSNAYTCVYALETKKILISRPDDNMTYPRRWLYRLAPKTE